MQDQFVENTNLPSISRTGRVLLELWVGYGLIVLVIWSSRPLQRYLYWIAVLWIAVVTYFSFDGLRAMGLRVTGFHRSLWLILPAIAVASVGVVIAHTRGTLHPPHGGFVRFVATFWGYCLWAFFQQFLMQDFMLLRFLRFLPAKAAVVATAVLFALAHLPNPILTPLTLLWGLAACALFLRYRNLYVLAVVHAILGVTLAISVPANTIHNMRVGLGYLTYRSHGQHRLPSLSQP